MITPQVGETYRHRKGGIYVIVAIATHTENDSSLVIYTDGKKTWARPYHMFVDGRFEKVV